LCLISDRKYKILTEEKAVRTKAGTGVMQPEQGALEP
jgi:hypothetical protein